MASVTRAKETYLKKFIMGRHRRRGSRVSRGGRERQPTVSVAFSLHQALFTIFCESFIFICCFFLVRLKGLVYSTASTLYKRVT